LTITHSNPIINAVSTLHHTTDAADVIVREGFRDAEGSYMFAGLILRGVFLAIAPANINDGATGDQVLEVTFPDDIDLTDYAIVEDGHPQWEWCVPAELIKRRATVRLLTADESDAVCVRWWHG
jgi:hypothetical protein